jgi:hypothetical protein
MLHGHKETLHYVFAPCIWSNSGPPQSQLFWIPSTGDALCWADVTCRQSHDHLYQEQKKSDKVIGQPCNNLLKYLRLNEEAGRISMNTIFHHIVHILSIFVSELKKTFNS